MDAVVTPHMSLHERYMAESNAERGRDGVRDGYKMQDLRGAGDLVHGQTRDVSPVSEGSGSGGRASPHPGTVVVV
jgi:hypothetical protein